ncbi:MAG: CAP domain-containing protein, partial [Myxococcota bacterium]
VVLLSRRLVELRPLAKRVSVGARIRLSGSLVPPASTPAQVTLALGLPNGSVVRQSLGRVQERFATTFQAPTTPGIVQVQLLVDRGAGPEIAALFPVGVDADPFDGTQARGTSEAAAPLTDSASVESEIVALVVEARRAERLTLPTLAPELVEASRAHGTDMRDGGFFAHVSPTQGDVAGRLRHLGIGYQRALENLATGRSAAEIFRAWMTSPAHRANLLDPSVNRFGIGVVLQATSSGARAYAVAILVEEPSASGTRTSAVGAIP